MEINEKSVSKQQQKFFGVVRGIQTGEIKSASPAAKKAAASMSKKDVKDFAATKHKGLPKKVDELKTTKENVKSTDKKPEVFTKPAGKRGVRMVSVDREVVKNEETDDINEKGKGLWHNIRAKRKRGEPRAKPGDKDYPKTLNIESTELDEAGYKVPKNYTAMMAKKKKKKHDPSKDISVADYKKKTGKKTVSLKHLTKNTHIDPFREGYIGGKGEKGRDYHNAGTFDKETAYRHAKTHNGVVHKDTSGSYLVKHGRGKNVSEESVDEVWRKQSGFMPTKRINTSSAKYKEAEMEYQRDQELARKRKQQKPAKKESSVQSFATFIAELTDKQKAEIAARKTKNLAKRGARRGPSKGTKPSEGDWTAQQQKSAKPLSFEINKNDKHDDVHKTLAKAADASHPSLGGRKVTVKINGKSKEMAHKDLQHAVDLHKRLPLGKKAAVMNLIRDKGHDGVTAAANHFRKTYK